MRPDYATMTLKHYLTCPHRAYVVLLYRLTVITVFFIGSRFFIVLHRFAPYRQSLATEISFTTLLITLLPSTLNFSFNFNLFKVVKCLNIYSVAGQWK